MYKGYKFNIQPSGEQEELLAKHFGACRFIYNWALEKKINSYKENKKKLSAFDLIKEITALKQLPEFYWLTEVSIMSLQSSVLNMGKAFENFFRYKKGFPKFKSKNFSKQSFQYPMQVRIDQEKHLIKLPKFKQPFKIKGLRKFEGKIGTTTVSREPNGKYYVSILVDDGKELPAKRPIQKDNSIAIDVGIKEFATLSNGEVIANPKLTKKHEKNLAKHQRRLARKVKGGNRRKRQKVKVAKVHKKIANVRADFLHKLSNELTNKFDTICIEDLNISGMVKNHNLAKAVNDCSWSEFFRMLNYKAEWKGKNILEVGRFEPSSKTCSCCGFVKVDLKLSDRNWTCESCGSEHERDLNASKNILNFGFKNLSPSGRGVGDVELLALARA